MGPQVQAHEAAVTDLNKRLKELEDLEASLAAREQQLQAAMQALQTEKQALQAKTLMAERRERTVEPQHTSRRMAQVSAYCQVAGPVLGVHPWEGVHACQCSSPHI